MFYNTLQSAYFMTPCILYETGE